jgi:hypothetical protein
MMHLRREDPHSSHITYEHTRGIETRLEHLVEPIILAALLLLSLRYQRGDIHDLDLDLERYGRLGCLVRLQSWSVSSNTEWER